MLSGIFPMSKAGIQIRFQQLLDELRGQEQTLVQLCDALAKAVSYSKKQFSDAQDQMQDTCQHLDALQSKAENIISQNHEIADMQSEHFQHVMNSLDSICTAIFNKEAPLNIEFEKSYYNHFPTGTSDSYPAFQSEFLALVQGLDPESIKTISLELNRLNIIKNSKEEWLPLYVAEEKLTLQCIQEYFFNCIVPLSPTCFYWNRYLLPINHFESCVFWDRCGIPHLNHPERLNNLDIIDAGAFIGDSALILSELTSGTVHAFEPVPGNYQHMLETIELNGKTNIVPKLAALGDRCGKLTISVSDSSSSHFENLALSYQGTVDADVVTLDEYVATHGLHVGLIKADIEGAEQMLLRGAMDTIKTQRPALLISIYHNADDFFHIKPMLERLNLGYHFKVRHPICGSVLTETLLIAEID